MRQDITGKIVNIKPLHTVFTLMITDVGGKAATDFALRRHMTTTGGSLSGLSQEPEGCLAAGTGWCHA